MSSKDSPDFITKYPDAIKVITDEKLYFSLLEDPNIEPIIVILREGPLTLDELVDRYNQYVAMRGKEKKLSKKEIEDAQKSETSVYRYIKKLEEEGLVFEAGRRIDPDGRTTKALFSRTAKLFIPATASKEWWETPSSKRIIEATAQMFALSLGKKNPDVECIKEFMLGMDAETSKKSAEFYNNHNDELTEITKDMGFKEIDKALTWLNYLLLMQHSAEYLEKLNKCFKS